MQPATVSYWLTNPLMVAGLLTTHVFLWLKVCTLFLVTHLSGFKFTPEDDANKKFSDLNTIICNSFLGLASQGE